MSKCAKNKCKNVTELVFSFFFKIFWSFMPMFTADCIFYWVLYEDQWKGSTRVVFRYYYCYLSTCIGNLEFVTWAWLIHFIILDEFTSKHWNILDTSLSLHSSSKSFGHLFQCSLLTVFSTGCCTSALLMLLIGSSKECLGQGELIIMQ